jgi:hypothetical protein
MAQNDTRSMVVQQTVLAIGDEEHGFHTLDAHFQDRNMVHCAQPGGLFRRWTVHWKTVEDAVGSSVSSVQIYICLCGTVITSLRKHCTTTGRRTSIFMRCVRVGALSSLARLFHSTAPSTALWPTGWGAPTERTARRLRDSVVYTVHSIVSE